MPNPRIRVELARHYDRNMFPLVNVLGMVACEAAYAHGEPWLDDMLVYVRANHLHFAEGIARATDRIRVLPADSLYLAWMDCRGLGMEPATLDKFMLTKARVWLNKGSTFGVEGHGYMRANLGCPRATVDEAIGRITAAVAAL